VNETITTTEIKIIKMIEPTIQEKKNQTIVINETTITETTTPVSKNESVKITEHKVIETTKPVVNVTEVIIEK
jgi:hypothetical protein